jgi:hypothetical protein
MVIYVLGPEEVLRIAYPSATFPTYNLTLLEINYKKINQITITQLEHFSSKILLYYIAAGDDFPMVLFTDDDRESLVSPT